MLLIEAKNGMVTKRVGATSHGVQEQIVARRLTKLLSEQYFDVQCQVLDRVVIWFITDRTIRIKITKPVSFLSHSFGLTLSLIYLDVPRVFNKARQAEQYANNRVIPYLIKYTGFRSYSLMVEVDEYQVVRLVISNSRKEVAIWLEELHSKPNTSRAWLLNQLTAA